MADTAPVTSSLPGLVERSGEVATIDAFVRRIASGDGAALVVEGVAGIGKTTLLRRAATTAAEREVQVLSAVGSELESDIAFGVVRQLFRPVDLADEALFSGAAELARTVVDPVVARPRSGTDALPTALHGLHWLAMTLASRRPLLLRVDDAQWADAHSLRWLHYLTRRIDGVGIGIVVGVRTGTGRNDEALAALKRESTTAVLRPLPLSAIGTTQLVRSRSADASDEFCSAAHRVCGGNPYLLEEVINALGAEGRAADDDAAREIAQLASEQVAQAVLLRISQHPGDAVEFARAVAILGASATPTRAARLAGVADAAVPAVVDALVRADVLADDLPFGFRHPLVQQSVYADMAAPSRAARHRAAALLLLDGGAADDEVVGQLLLSDALNDTRAGSLLRRAAAQARATGAADTAALLLRRALDEPSGGDRWQLLLELGRAELAAADPMALAHLRQALDHADLPAARAEVAAALAEALLMHGDVRAGIDLLTAELKKVAAADVDAAGRLAAAHATLALQFTGSRDELRSQCSRLVAEVRDPAVRRSLAAVLATVSTSRAERQSWLRAAWDGGALLDDVGVESSMPMSLALAALVTGDIEIAEDIASHLLRAATGRGPLASGIAHATCAFAELLTGRLLDAETDATVALTLAEDGGWALGKSWGRAMLARVLVERGDLVGAERVLDAAAPTSEPVYGALLFARALLRLTQQRYDEAIAALDEIKTLMPTGPDEAFEADFVRVRALARAGRSDEALDLAQKLLAVLPEDVPLARIDALSAVAEATSPPEAVAAWQRAEEAADASPYLLHRGYAALGYGMALRRRRQLAPARAALRRALDIAERCHAGWLADRAAAELVDAGGRPRRRTDLGVEALSPSERRVCRLAADGMSNVAIAQSLFVSVKTVETQLSSAYRKLQVTGRAQLGPALAVD